jgi:O-antigen ligase
MRKVLPAIILLPLFASLLNSGVFGSVSLFAWFFYMIFSGVVALLIFFRSIFFNGNLQYPPTYVWLFLAFAGYVCFHGFITGTIGFEHYYWIANGLVLLAFYFLFGTNQENFVKYIYTGITFLAILESLVVLFQCIGVVPVQNNLFLCTGTWVNPNVTAIFLSFTLFAVLQVFKSWKKPLVTNFLLLLIISSILLLSCRTAHLVTLLFITYHYKEHITGFWKSKNKFNTDRLLLLVFLLIIFFAFLSPFLTKQRSLEARLNIWKNSIALSMKEPVTGYGFGRFEKEYNLFTASQKNTENSHINMAYNDFLEMTVEGGLPALLLWILFLFFLARFCKSKGRSIIPVIAIVVVQLTNFGFQAIPFMALLILYLAAGCRYIHVPNEAKAVSDIIVNANPKLIYSGLIIVSTFFCFKIIESTGAYHEQKKLHENLRNPTALFSFARLQSILSFSDGYHENFGDAFMQRRQYAFAISQYKQALNSCSRTDVFAKTGFCYRMLQQYDSSEHYYQVVQDIEPQKLIPRMALLQLFQQKRDTIQVLKKANEIIELPVRIVSRRGQEIKEYARLTIAKIDSARNIYKTITQTIQPFINQN